MPGDTSADPDATPDSVEYATPSKDYLRGRLQRIDPYDFEVFVADVWGYLGWKTQTVGEPINREVNMIATDSDAKQVMTGSFSRQAEDPAPDLGVILVGGENFRGSLTG